MLYLKAAGFRPALLLFLAGAAFAGQTRTWSESEYSEFEKGNLKNLSLRSDGVITLAPKFQELNENREASMAWVGSNKAEFTGQVMAAMGARIAQHIAEKGTADIRPEFAALMGGAAPAKAE